MSVFGGAHDNAPSLHSQSSSDEAPFSPPNDDIIVQPEVDFDSDLESDLYVDSDSGEQLRKKPLTEKQLKAYRGYYTEETQLINAFETARSGDLGRNLLGFASERHVNLSKHPAKTVTSWGSRNRWTDNRRTRDTLPARHWTAWPLPPDEVPSPNERFNGARDDESHNHQAKRRMLTKPSAEFEEALCDFTIWKAREKLDGASESASEPSGDTKKEGKGKQKEKGIDLESKSGQKKNESIELTLPNDEGSILSFSADQDWIYDILRPTTRSVMSKFDALMMGLYHSRMNHRAHRSSSRDGGLDPARPKSSSSSEGEKKEALGLRDWSEVLGMASLTGWDPKIVGRAAQRCSKIFGEGMSFANLDAENPSIEPIEYKPDMVPKFEEEDPWTLESLICPHEDCSRHTRGFDVKRRLRWHLKDVHDWDPAVEGQPPKILGGVHLDGFMQPISAQPGWRSKDKAKSGRRSMKRKKEPESEVVEMGLVENNDFDN